MHRFFTTLTAEKPLVITDIDQVHQIRDVLKLRAGEQLTLVGESGREMVCEIISVGKKDISLGLVEEKANEVEPKRLVTLYCAILKRDNFELACQKATECGVSVIVPILTEHTVKLGLNVERVKKIMLEAAEQSGRCRVPELQPVAEFKNVIGSFDGTGIFFEKSDQIFLAKDVQGKNEVAIFVGPEGGWSEKEKILAEEAGLLIRSLGPRILRAETAAVVATFNAVLY